MNRAEVVLLAELRDLPADPRPLFVRGVEVDARPDPRPMTSSIASERRVKLRVNPPLFVSLQATLSVPKTSAAPRRTTR